MAEETERVFPLFERRTPLLDRLRNEEGAPDAGLGAALGKATAESVMSDSEEELSQKSEKVSEEFRQAMAESLGVDEENIRDDVVEQASKLIAGLKEQDVLTDDALEQLGISGGGGEEQSEEAEGDEGSFLEG